MVAGSLVAPQFQGNPLKITTVKPWIRACFAQSPSNALQFLVSDGRRASLVLPTGKVFRDLHGLEACRDKIVRVSATYDGSSVVALTSDGHCWLHNCALGQSQAIDLPPDSLPFEFSPKVKRQQLWDLQLEACAATSLACFSWIGPAGNLIRSMPFATATTTSKSVRDVVWAHHEEQTAAGVITIGSFMCSAAILSLEGWVTITSSLVDDKVANASGDSWKVNISCSLFSVKDGTSEPTGSCISDFSVPSPFLSAERSELSKRTSSMHSSRYKPALFAVHGGQGLIALVMNCSLPCVYLFYIDTDSDVAQHPKISLPLNAPSGAAQEFVCDAAWVCQGWWLVLLLSSGRLLVFDRRGVLLSWTMQSPPGVEAMGTGIKLLSSIQIPSEMLALHEAEWTVTPHPVQPYVAVCTGFFISVVVLPSPNHFISSALSAVELSPPSPEWVAEYASIITRTTRVSSQPSCALDVIVIKSHLWCLALSKPVAVEFPNIDKLCQALSSSLVSAAAASDSKRQVLVDSLRSFLVAGHQATYLCPRDTLNQSHKFDFACIQVIVSALVNSNAAEDAAVLLCACRKRCDDSKKLMTQSQYISCIRFIISIWKEILGKKLQGTAANEIAALEEILAAESISLASIGSFPVDRQKEAFIARAMAPTATALESAICFCRAGQSVAALSALINGGHLAAVVATTLRMQGAITGSSCTALLSSAINGKCWTSPLLELSPKDDVEECKEDASIDDCLSFILKTSSQVAVHCVVRFAAAVGALSLCGDSNIELLCLQSSQCINIQSDFIACPVALRLKLSTDPSIWLGFSFEHEHCQPISVHACSFAFKDILTESFDHGLPHSGLELAWVLCLLAGCGAEAALLATASVEVANAFASLLSFCDRVTAAASSTQSPLFVPRVVSFIASACEWINGNVNSLSSFFLSPENIELLQFSLALPDANSQSCTLLAQNMDQICSEAVRSELNNLCRHISGDLNLALSSNIKHACKYLAFRSRNVSNPARQLILFFWSVVDNHRPAFKSLPSSASLKFSAVAMTKAQLLLEFSIAIFHLEPSFLDFAASFCVTSIENALRSGSGSGPSISREHLILNISLLCVAMRKGAISNQRHKLRAIAQSIKSISAHANSMINSLFESEHAGLHDDEFDALGAELSLRYDNLKESHLQNSQRFVIELKSSADTVLSSLSEELWVCHCALMASCCLVMYDTNTIAPSALVPRLHSSISSAAKLLPEDDAKYSNPSFCVITDAVDHASQSACGVPFSTMRSLSPIDLPSSRAATLRFAPSGPIAGSAAKQKILSPREQPLRFSSNIPTRLPSNLPVEPLSSGSVSSGNEFRPTRNINAHESEVNAISISVDRASLFSAGNDRSIKKWQLDRCFCIKSVLLDHEVTCLAISSDGQYIFSGGIEIVVWTHDLRRVHTVLKGSSYPILSMSVTMDHVIHATTCEDVIKKFQPVNEDLTLWSLIEIPIFGSQTGAVPHCAHPITLSPSGNHLFVGKNEEYVMRSQLLPLSMVLTNYVLALAVSRDEQVVATAGTKLCTFRATGEELRSFDWTGRWITCLALSHTAHLLFSAGNDGKLHVWDCLSGACISSIQAHSQAVTALVLSQDQQWIYTASKDCSVNEFHVASLPGMSEVDLKPLASMPHPHHDSAQLPDFGNVENIGSIGHNVVELGASPKLVESAEAHVNAVSASQHVQTSPAVPVAPSMSDVLSGMRSDGSISHDSDDDFDSNFSRISSAIERLQGTMRQHVSEPTINSAESDHNNLSFYPDGGMNARALHLAERVGRPQRLHILSKAKSTLMQQQVKLIQPLPAAHFVVDLGDVDASSDETSSPAFTSPARSAVVQTTSPVVYGSMYMPVTSPQSSPRQLQTRVNVHSAQSPAANPPRSLQSVPSQELRARARHQQEHVKGNLSHMKVSRSAASKHSAGPSVDNLPASSKLPVRLLRVSSPASASQVAAAAGAPLLLPLPVQSKAERLSALAPSVVPKNTSDVRLLAPRPSSAPVVDDVVEQSVNSNMLVMSPDELQQLVRSAVSSAMSSSAQPVPPCEATAFDEIQHVPLVRSPVLINSPPVQSIRLNQLSPQNNSQHSAGSSVIQNPSSPASPALLRESRSALVQTDGDELPRRAPSPRAQSTRQAINDAYNSSLPTSRHVHVLSVAPGASAASEHMDSAGLMEARSVAVMRGQPPVVVEDTLSPGKVSRMLLSGHHDVHGGSAATLDRRSLARQFSSQPDPVQLVSASLSAFERKLSFLEQQAAQVEVTLGISGQHQAQGRSVLDSINSRLGAVLDIDVQPEPPLIPSQLSSALQPKTL